MSKEMEELEMALSIPTNDGMEPLDGLFNEEEAKPVALRRTSKGGRNTAMDARLNPNLDPKKAARIMANR